MNISSNRGNGLSCLTGLLFWDLLLTLLKSFLQATVLWLKSKLSPSIERLFLCCTENSVLKIKTEHKITPRRNRIPPTETTCLRFIFSMVSFHRVNNIIVRKHFLAMLSLCCSKVDSPPEHPSDGTPNERKERAPPKSNARPFKGKIFDFALSSRARNGHQKDEMRRLSWIYECLQVIDLLCY